MKKNLLIISAFLLTCLNIQATSNCPKGNVEKGKTKAVSVALAGENQVQTSIIEMTTAAGIGEYIMLSINADGPLEVTGAELKYGGMAEVKDAHIVIKGIITGVDCTEAQLTSLNLSQAPNFTTLICNSNSLENLEVGNLKELKILYCNKNKIKALDVKNNLKLEELDCCENELTTLDVTANSALKILLAYHNQLSAINVAQNPLLIGLDMSENKLSALDVTANTKLETIYCNGNNINDAAMEALVKSLPNRTDRAEKCHFFAIDTKNANEKNVIFDAQVKASNAKNWQVLDYSAGDNDGNGIEYGGTSGVKPVATTSPATLKIAHHTLSIHNLLPQSKIKVYSVSGELLGEKSVKTDSTAFYIGNQTMVIAVINGVAHKISK